MYVHCAPLAVNHSKTLSIRPSLCQRRLRKLLLPVSVGPNTALLPKELAAPPLVVPLVVVLMVTADAAPHVALCNACNVNAPPLAASAPG